MTEDPVALRIARAAATPGEWFNTAEELLMSASALWDAYLEECKIRPDGRFGSAKRASALVRAFELLAGFALENAFKGVLAGRGKIQLSTKKQKSKIGFHRLKKSHLHNLPALAEAAGFELSGRDLALARNLSHAIAWAARYPVPLDPSTYERFWSERENPVAEDGDLERLGALLTRCRVAVSA